MMSSDSGEAYGGWQHGAALNKMVESLHGIWLFRLDSMAMTLGFVCGFPCF